MINELGPGQHLDAVARSDPERRSISKRTPNEKKIDPLIKWALKGIVRKNRKPCKQTFPSLDIQASVTA